MGWVVFMGMGWLLLFFLAIGRSRLREIFCGPEEPPCFHGTGGCGGVQGFEISTR